MADKCPTCGRRMPKPKEPKPKPDLQLVEEAYIEQFTIAPWNQDHNPPKITFGRDRKYIKDMMAVWGAERIISEIPIYLKTDDPFLKKLGYSIYGLECFIKGRMAGGYGGSKNSGNGGQGGVKERAREMLGLRRGSAGRPATVHQPSPGNGKAAPGGQGGSGPLETGLDTTIIEGSCVEIVGTKQF